MNWMSDRIRSGSRLGSGGGLYCLLVGGGLCLLAWSGQAEGAEYWLWAGQTSLTLPDGSTVPMWGYALEPDGNFTTLEGTVSVPGPELTVPAGDTSLVVHLYNQGVPTPVSLYIPQLYTPLQPVFFSDAQGRRRVRSFTTETAPGATQTYRWDGVNGGTYLYSSGTHPAVQVQMGLYGAVRADAAAGKVYPGIGYDRQLTLVYSELDPALHTAVDSGTYGTAAFPSAFEYHPTWFLVNGRPFTSSQPPINPGEANTRFLLRMLNAGLREHAPLMLGDYLSVLGEDGARYPFSKELHTLLIGPGKTLDVLWEPTLAGSYALVDRMLDVSNAGARDGGQQVRFTIGDNGGAPVAGGDVFSTPAGASLTVNAPGVLANDSDPNGDALSAQLLESVGHGSLTLSAAGAFTYTPTSGFVGTDQFTYRVVAGGQTSASTRVVIYVERRNEAPVAANDAYSVPADETLEVPAPGVLTNDSDRDGDALQAVLEVPPTQGDVRLQPDGSLSYVPFGEPGVDQFRYSATDGAATSAEATVSVTIQSPTNTAPVANDDTVKMKRNTSLDINVAANDTDANGFIEPTTVTLVNLPSNGTAGVNADGSITYTPARSWRGTDVFTYLVYDNGGAASNVATVRVNVVR